MLPSSRKAELTWSPVEDAKPGIDPIYRFRPPSRDQRDQWRARVIGVAGSNPSDADIRRVVLVGVDALWDDLGDRAALMALWDEGQASQAAVREILTKLRAAKAADADADVAPFQADVDAATMPQERLDQLQRLDDTLRLEHQPYARAMERRALWQQLAPRIAVEMFCTGWSDVADDSGAPVPFRRDAGKVADAAMVRLDDNAVELLGYRIIDAMFPGAAAAKKPDSPSGSAAAPTSSSTTENLSSGPTATAG